VGPFDGRPWPFKVGHKNAKTPPLVTPPQENPKPKTENFFLTRNYWTCWIRRGFEHLSSYSGWRVCVGHTWQKNRAHSTHCH